MMYSSEVEHMCPLAKGAYRGASVAVAVAVSEALAQAKIDRRRA